MAGMPGFIASETEPVVGQRKDDLAHVHVGCGVDKDAQEGWGRGR